MINGILQCTNIVELDISHNRIRDLTGISFLPKLKTIKAAYNYINDIEPLGRCETLKILDLSNNKLNQLTETITT